MSGGDWKEMFKAACDGDLALLRYHVESGADINYAHPEFLATPLVASILAKQEESALYLLTHGADPHLRSEFDGLTPAQAAHQVGLGAVADRLRAMGAWSKPESTPMKVLPIPFPTLRTSLVILRVGVPTLFMAHAVVRIVNGTVPQFAAFLGGIGFPQPLAVVWVITLTELVAGTMLALGYRQRSASIALAAIAAGGIALIHHRFGWFVGEHGAGGSEYSVSLLLSLLVLAAADPKHSRHATQQQD